MGRWVISLATALTAVAALLAAAGCGGPTTEPPGIALQSSGSAPSSAGRGGSCVAEGPTPPPADAAVVDLTLPCLGGTQAVRLSALGRPAVINLWASWCAPCRQELSAFQRLADNANEAVLVLGVATEDTPGAAQSLVDDLKLTFPMLYDKDGKLKQAAGKVALPVTVFLDASGQVANVYNGPALDEATLRTLTERHLGISVGP
jgi:thiol-disulfide isomerase/thioredoxin